MLKKADYTKVVRRPYPPLFASSFFAGMLDRKNYQGFIENPCFITQTIQIDYSFYYIRQEQEKIGWAAFRDWNSVDRIKKVDNFLVEKEKELLAAAQGASLNKYLQAYSEYGVVILPIQQAEGPTEEKITKSLTKKVGAKKTRALMNSLNIPLRDNYYKQEEYDLATSDDLQGHVKKYAFLNSRYGQYHPYTVKEVRKKLAQFDASNYVEKRATEKEKIKQAIIEAREILESQDQYLVDLMQFVIYYRTRRTDVLNRSSFEAHKLLDNSAQAFGLTYEQLLYCLADEVLNDDIPPQDILEERLRGYDIYVENGKIVCVHGQESKEVRKMFAQDLGKTKEIKGIVASPGEATGKVRVVFTEQDLAELKEGEIIVATMTTPDMVPAMRRAAAIITDEGGITCHAAIISRELRKPCIINAKIATQVLRDREEIRVDANKGNIKRLV